MALASGLGSQLGLKKETTWGTAVTVDKFYEFDSDSLNLAQSYQDSVGLKAGRTIQPSGRMVQTTRGVAGDTPMQVPTKLFGTILDLMHGATVAPVQQGATAAYLQTHPIGTTQPNKSATIQINKPDTGGTDHAFTYPGAVLTSVAFACDAGGVLTVTLTWDAKDETTPSTTPSGAALASASYASGVTSWVGTGTGVVLNVNGSPYGSAKSWSLTWTQPYYTDRYYMGSGGLKGKPIPNGFATLNGTVAGDWDAETLYLLYRSGAIIDIFADFQGATIASTFKEQIKFDCTSVQLRGDSPNVGGPDVLSQSINFMGGDNGSVAPLTILYESTDVTL
jgi:hypothetical protein